MVDGNIRLLAAIMFTDMVGYTALMQEDEEKAIFLREKHRKILENTIPQYQGRILQYYGDGTLSIFGSAIEAVRCSIDIQNSFQTAPKIPVRIGIHIGDVVYEDDGVFGDGVNIASRIESLGIAGGVLISDKIHDEIKNHPEFQTISQGFFELKNVRRPIEIFSLMNKGLATPKQDELKLKTKTSFKSIAVLPFVNMSSDKENEFFSDGITEDLLNALSKVAGLQVTSRTSAFAFKGKNIDIREIGKQLAVSSVLEGSVRKVGNRVRITAQLINTIDGYHIWSESFDRELEDIFAVQDEISKRIANILREKLTTNELSQPLVKKYTSNINAYSVYLKGLYYWNKFTPEMTFKAIDMFNQVIQIEPEFPLSYARLSGCYTYLGAIGIMKPDIAYPRAKDLAYKALDMDKTLEDCHVAIGMVKLFYEWDFKGSEESLLKALEINPGYATAFLNYSMYLSGMHRLEEAKNFAEKAATLDPLSPVILDNYADTLMYNGNFEDANYYYQKTLELDPSFRNALYGIGWNYYYQGDLEKALQIFEKVINQLGHPLKGLTTYGYICAKLGLKEKVIEIIKKTKERELLEPETSMNMDFAVLYAGIEDWDNVFIYLEKAFIEKSGGLLFLWSLIYKKIHNTERFKNLLKRIGLEYNLQD
ncbi:MAG: tetratricopeptide repeat protein [Melioribacteraceae bacterium]|nr:tetratricopeptide repeat protein [Melioribacteraceae bacterium]